MLLFLALFLHCISSTSLPNILWIVVDDLGYSDVGYKGAEFKTTNIDKLATTGIDLTNYYVEMDCTPTRSAFMTGRYPWRIGMQNPATMNPGCIGHIPFDTPTIAELMKTSEYNTQMIGKWHLGFAAKNMTPNGRGFNDYFGYYNGAEDYYYHDLAGGYDLVYNGIPEKKENGTYNADLFFGYFNELLQNSYNKSSNNYTEQPLFMYLSLQTVHAPIQQPPSVNINNFNMKPLYSSECGHINNTYRMFYCQKLQYIDIYLGDLIQLYIDFELWDDTLLIFTTDNGGMPDWNPWGIFNQTLTKSYGSNYPLRGGKVTGFQGGMLGISFINGGSNIISSYLRGTSNNGLFGAMDWFPSILSFIGQNQLIPDNLDGENILNSLLNGTLFPRDQLIGYVNFDIEQEIIVDSIVEAGMIKDDWKLIYGSQIYDCYYPPLPNKPICLTNETITDKWLFNITDDPFESKNLVEQYPEVVVYLLDLIVEDTLKNGYKYNYLDVVYNSSCPHWHDGCWVSWLEDAPERDIILPQCP